jgi:hypothetical protein
MSEADGILRFSLGNLARSDDPGEFVLVRREGANRVALQTVGLLCSGDDIDEPRAVRLSGSAASASGWATPVLLTSSGETGNLGQHPS